MGVQGAVCLDGVEQDDPGGGAGLECLKKDTMKWLNSDNHQITYNFGPGDGDALVGCRHQADVVAGAAGQAVQSDLVLGGLAGEGVLVEARHASHGPGRGRHAVRHEGSGHALEGLEVDEVARLLGVLQHLQLILQLIRQRLRSGGNWGVNLGGIDLGGGGRHRGVVEGVGRHHVGVEVLGIRARRRD